MKYIIMTLTLIIYFHIPASVDLFEPKPKHTKPIFKKWLEEKKKRLKKIKDEERVTQLRKEQEPFFLHGQDFAHTINRRYNQSEKS